MVFGGRLDSPGHQGPPAAPRTIVPVRCLRGRAPL